MAVVFPRFEILVRFAEAERARAVREELEELERTEHELVDGEAREEAVYPKKVHIRLKQLFL